MPRAKRPNHTTDSEPLTSETRTLVETLRAMASQVEADPALAAQLMAGQAMVAAQEAPTQAASRPAREVVAPPLDPFAALRRSGEQGLQQALAALDLASLKAVVRAYRLDPARISARWTAPERIIDLILEQARARLNHGRAFERI
jgi:hypothetical protein